MEMLDAISFMIPNMPDSHAGKVSMSNARASLESAKKWISDEWLREADNKMKETYKKRKNQRDRDRRAKMIRSPVARDKARLAKTGRAKRKPRT